jgi:hypothetical protein
MVCLNDSKIRTTINGAGGAARKHYTGKTPGKAQRDLTIGWIVRRSFFNSHGAIAGNEISLNS